MNEYIANDVFESISETLRSAIGRNKVKYKLLKECLTIKRINAIHIDLDSIFSFVVNKYADEYRNTIDESFRYVIAGAVLNLVGHYRHYCIRNEWVPNIYIYVSYNKWGSSFDEAIRVIEIISTYLSGIYLIKVGMNELPCIAMKYFIDSNKEAKNLVITKSYIDLQLLNSNTNILHTNKDNSILYSSENVFDILGDAKDHYDISCELVGPYLFFAGVGTNNHGVKGYGKKKAVKLFDSLIKSGYLYNGKYESYEDFKRDVSRGVEVSFECVHHNFSVFHLESLYNKYMTASKKKILDSFIIDKFSRKDIADLNNKYFTGNDSLNLEFLLEVPASPNAGGNSLRW